MYNCIYVISPPPHGIIVLQFTGGVLLLFQGYQNCPEKPGYLAGEPSPRTERHRELNPGPPDPQTNAPQTELTHPLTSG